MITRDRTRHQKIFPVSYSQQRLWLLDRLDPGTLAYNIARAIRLRGALSVPALRDSLASVVARHEALRTTFAEVDGEPMQVVTPEGSLDLPTIDLSHVPEAERASETLRIVREEARRPFDLTSGPLIRVALLRLSTDDHVLMLFMHHIITDAWSMSVLWKEVAHLYERAVAGRPPALPDLSMQYADFARWQRAALRPEVLDRHLAYCRRQFTGVDPVLDLPTDRARPPVRTPFGAVQRLALSKTSSNQLSALSRQANCTLFMTLLAAVQVLLWRYSGVDDILIGSPTAGRSDVALEPLIGFFVNTVVLRADLSGDPTFRELLGRVRETALEAYAHQDVPFEKLIEDLNVPRSLSHTPLFQVMFILHNTPTQAFELPGLSVEPMEFDCGTAKFDLTVEITETNDGLDCAFEYSTDVFEHATVERMLGHFRSLLEGIARDPGARVSALPVVTAAERHQLLIEWNDTAVPYPLDQCIHQLFEAQALRTPDAVALICRDERLTYRELNSRANQLAADLRTRGVERETLVGVCIERSIEAIVALLAILKAGGAYVPMDPVYPKHRLAFMLGDSRAPVLLTVERLTDRLPTTAAEVICLDTARHRVEQESVSNSTDVTGPHGLAYVVYTSGSTGTPKGVLAPHSASINRFAWMWNRWKFTPTDVCCQKTALSFVDSVWEIFGPLLQGVPSVIIPDEVLQDPPRLIEALSTNRVTRIVLVPSLLRLMLDSGTDLGGKLRDLKLWFTSGEATTPELARRFEEALPDATLVNLYGSSEAAADVTAYVIRDSRSLERIPIGRPIANTRVYVLDRALNPMPIGVAGEIYVGGVGLARGYLRNPELTAQKFVPDPFVRDLEARLYATGDRGRVLPDGNIEFLGRVDTQVKIRGVRIELGEIESVLRTHPSIQAAVVTVGGAAGDERLIGYVIANDGPVEPDGLRRFMRERLPDYMVPSSFVNLDAFPLTPSGKVNRRALPPPSLETRREYAAPRSPMEEALAAIMAEVLNIPSVGIHDNFFELGGHSLLGIQVIARVRKVFRVELRLRCLFEEPTVAGLWVEIQKAERSGERSVVPSPTRGIGRREHLLARLGGLSDDEVEALLRSLQAADPDERVTEHY